MEHAKRVAHMIKERRKKLSISQARLAKLTGVSRQCVSLWESGAIKTIKVPNIIALEKALRIPNGELLNMYS